MNPLHLSDSMFPAGAPGSIPLRDAEEQAEPTAPPAPQLVDYDTRKKQITQLIGDWKEEQDRVTLRRKLRKNRKNVAELRNSGDLLDDETCIADHTIDKNIAQEKSAYMQYIEASRTLLTFTPRPLNTVPRDILTVLEESFTQGARYDRWKIPWYRIIDGTILHGAIGFEVVFDETKPLHFGIDYIRRENFIYPTKMIEVEKTDMYLRVYEYPLSQFESWLQQPDWNQQALRDLIERNKERRNQQIKVYKVYFREQGVIMSAWYSDTANAQTWLKAPQPHHIGFMIEEQAPMMDMLGMPQPPRYVPEPCRQFPFVLFRYTETEDELVLDIPGRAAMDVYTQEAITSLMTDTVNGAHRAAGLYVGAEPAAGDAPNPGTIKLKSGVVQQGKLTFHQPAWPNNIALQVIQALSVRNTQEMGRVDFAAMQRQDTAKTATEIGAAQTQAAALGSIKVSLFADALTRAYQIGWTVARSQQLAGQITLLEQFPPEILKHDYSLTPSGDVEVLKRQEKLMQMQNFFGIIANTPAAVPFLKMLLRNAFPEESGELIQALDAGNKDVVIDSLANALEQVIPDLNPNEQNTIRQLIASARSVVVRPDDGGAAAPSGPTPTEAP